MRCRCGHRVSSPSAGGGAAGGAPVGGGFAGSVGGPYREAARADEPATRATCPYCSNDVPPMVRLCPHCDVRLDDVRCQRCYSLQPPGAFACGRCAHPLELEPLLDATDAPCPACRRPLEVAPGGESGLHECPRCGGMFVSPEALAAIVVRAELGGALGEREGEIAAGRARMLGDVRYRMCPLCHSSMNRVAFGRASGVIVDVCKLHGTWFDAGELTRAVAFASSSSPPSKPPPSR